jgi:hypothetical protein
MLYLGPCPADQEPTGSTINEQVQELYRYKQLLETLFPDYEAHECKFRVKSFDHDLGPYREVVIYFETTNPKSIDFAYNVDENLPATWEQTAILATVCRTENLDHFRNYKYPDDPNFI